MRDSPSSRRTSDSHPFEVAWVELDAAPGRLGLAMAPGRQDDVLANGLPWRRDLHTDLRRLRHRHRCDVLLSLLPDDELEAIGVPDLATEVSVHGIEFRRLRVRDGGVPAPEQEAEVLALVDHLRDQLLAGRTVVLHCRAGYGRSGTLAALLVSSLWELPQDAIARVRAAQPRAVETVQQEHYVHDAAYRWFRHHVATRPGGAEPPDLRGSA
jgi:cyclin-dependent kinase inhibitor 3